MVRSWWRRVGEIAGPLLNPATHPDAADAPLPLSGTGAIRAVCVVIFLAFGLGTVWAATAQLDAASVAPGLVVVDGQRKAVQHLEGGIIKAILVRDGDRVEAGDVVVEFQDDVLLSERAKLERQWVSAAAKRDRLSAERARADRLAFSGSLVAFAQDRYWAQQILDLQTALFEERIREIAGRIAALQERRQQSQQEVIGLNAQLQAQGSRLRIADQERAMTESLHESGHASKRSVLAHEREMEAVKGMIGDLTARIAAAKQKIAEIDQEMVNLEVSWTRSMGEELERLNDRIPELESGIARIVDQLTRTQVRAPVSGTVVGLNASTVGGVIAGSSTIMEIVPHNTRLIVEALVNPTDIDVVRRGQTVNVRLTSFSIRSVPPVPGLLVHLSADRVADPRTGNSAYLARVHLDEEQLASIGTVELHPGMPAEVMIQLGQRTVLDYMLAPLLRSFERGLNEE